jgi:stage II sporulation protein D
MARRSLATLTLVGASLLLALAPLSASAGSKRYGSVPLLVWTPATLVITGHGWGHGVGMSQWGAYGYALHGFDYEKIIAHYFPGTDIEPAGSKTIRVLLASGRPTLTVSSAAPFSVTDADGNSYDLPDLSVKLGPGLQVDVGNGSGNVALPGPIKFSAGSAPLVYGGRKYRGTFLVSVVDGKLRLINHVGLDAYLDGVVPCESPHDWPADALEAQAVVSRSYALTSVRTGSDFDVYPDTRSQVYRGISGEYPESNAAVQATSGQAVYYDGTVARTYFFSTSGGRTAAIQDVWPRAKPVPYLVSVNDPYDNTSPYHNWGPVTIRSQKLAKALRILGPITNVKTTSNPSKRVSTVTITAGDDETYQSTGNDLEIALRLRSNWFKVAVLALQHPQGRVAPDAKLRVSGIARGASSPALEVRSPGGSWEKVRDLAPGSAGAFKVNLRPKTTSFYRIVAAGAVGAPVRFTVAR